MVDFRAAICEDEKDILKYILKNLKASFREHGLDIHFDYFTLGEKLLYAISNGETYNILFLDIEMPGINGIDLCRKIHSYDYDTLVVFISNKEELVFQSFEVRPFWFIRKNHFLEELPALVRDIIQELDTQKSHIITITELNSTNVYSLNVNDIIYIEVISKYCHIKTTKDEVSFRYKLTELAALLCPYGFLQPHRSFLVNYRYISSISKECLVLDNHQQIPLSRKRIDLIKQQFLALSQGESL